ncbi:MAG TPA: hypothetical protein VGA03_03845 [Anaerolineales bacterium]
MNNFRTAFGIVVVIEALTFLLAGLAHLGRPIPLGFAVISEPRIVPATVVESLCGLLLLFSAYPILTGKRWSWTIAVIAHGFSLVGVLLGIAALALGGGPRTDLNDLYHRVMLVVLVGALIFLFSRPAKEALMRSGDTRQ